MSVFSFRKIFIVDKPFQYQFILKNLILLVFTFTLIIAAILIWEKYQVKQGFLLRPPPNSEIVAWAKANQVELNSADFFRQFLLQAKVYTFFQLLWKPLLLVLVINIIVLIVANIYYSHLIAGPIHRLKKVLEKHYRGERVYPLQFRKNDAFHDLAEVINRVLDLKAKEPK